jgi:hypothetical protein
VRQHLILDRAVGGWGGGQGHGQAGRCSARSIMALSYDTGSRDNGQSGGNYSEIPRVGDFGPSCGSSGPRGQTELSSAKIVTVD